MEALDEIKTVKDTIQAILKAKKTVRMYPDNNPIYTKTIDDTHSKFLEFFDHRDELILKIKQNEIFFDTEQVYYNPEKDDNLALFFFKDGLRELSFKKGLTAQELEEFLKLVSMDFEREAADDDIVTLLWEKDFQNIKYIADETFLLEDEDYESNATDKIRKDAPGVDEFQKAYVDSFNEESVKETPIINLTDKDLQLLVREIESDLEEKTEKLYKILFEVLLHSESRSEYEDVFQFLKNIIVYSLQHGDLKILISALKLTKDRAGDSEIINRTMDMLLIFANSDESVKCVGEILDSDVEIAETVLDEYTGFLDKSAITPFISVLGELKSIRGRGKVINILLQLGKKDIQPLLRGLQDSRWYVVRNIIYILWQIGDKKAMEHLINTARHNDARVRKESIKALGQLKNPFALPVLKDSLDDADLSVRKGAVKALSIIGTEGAKRIILTKVSDKEFKKRDFDERKEFYEALARWTDTDTVEFMIKTLKKRSIFRIALCDEEKACAAYCLGLMGHKDAIPVLEKLKDSRNKLLSEYVNNAIRKIEYGR